MAMPAQWRRTPARHSEPSPMPAVPPDSGHLSLATQRLCRAAPSVAVHSHRLCACTPCAHAMRRGNCAHDHPARTEAEIERLHYAEKWPIGTIATSCVHHETVRQVLAQAGVPVAVNAGRASLIDPYRVFLLETLTAYPTIRATRLLRCSARARLPRGHRSLPHPDRAAAPRPAAEAYLRPAHPGRTGTSRPGTPWQPHRRACHAPADGLRDGPRSYSRHLFLRFYLGAAMDNFLRGHVAAFWSTLQGVGRTPALRQPEISGAERRDAAIRFHPTLLDPAVHYRFQPQPVAVARGNEKASRTAIRYATPSLLHARSATSTISTPRRSPGARGRPPHGCVPRIGQQHRPRLRRRAALPHRAARQSLPHRGAGHERHVGKTPYARFDRNDYLSPYAGTAHVTSTPRSMACVSSTAQPSSPATGAVSTATSRSRTPRISPPSWLTRLPPAPTVPRTGCSMCRAQYAGAVPARRHPRRATRCTHPRLSRCSTSTAARRPSPPRYAKTARTSAPCVTSSISTPMPASKSHPSRCTCPMIRACARLSVRNHPLSDYEHLTPQPVDASTTNPHAGANRC